MNLLILVSIVISQIIFQVIYFESYYLNKKENILEDNIKTFESFIKKESNVDEIIRFIQNVKSEDNIALSFRDSDLSNGIGLESYMGSRYVVVNDEKHGKEYKVILGEQFSNTDIKRNDYIQVAGIEGDYGYVFPQSIFINGIELEKIYEIIPSKINNSAMQVIPSYNINSLEKDIYVDGIIGEVTKEDNSYNSLANADLYLSDEEKINIISNENYSARVKNNISVDEILFSSKAVDGGYIVAVTPLAEVNEVIGTMNSYYFMVFFIVLILVIVISLIYSKIMTKPLVEMSNMAKRISECDFQYKYNVNSEDEIGVLGSSLNLISENLEKSLSELKDTNLKLKNEMEVQKVLEEKRKELISNISHELKTPITIIQGSINGIKSGMYTTEMYEDILDETSKMNDLVKEMLEMSKLESPNFKISKGPFDLWSMVLKEKDKLRSMIKHKEVQIEFNDNDEDEMIVFADEKRINQVITNLLTNAIKYTPEGETIKVTISQSKDYDEYVFNIENFGVTLSDEEVEKIWDSFYRIEKSRNKSFGGTGLGLSIVRRILELHDSHYGVESEKNSVKFYFTLKKCRGY
ncbi:HAMP domain-containing sensor histidine kinase [Clostridium sp.]|uniref:sensor histidine kinase n=1 Tax=Clostridium sp. TaxID=1506 RepID=UPI0032172CB8